MASDPMPFPPPRRGSGLRTGLVLAGVAFLIGIGAALLVVRYYAGWIMPAPTASGTEAPGGNTLAPMFQPPPEADPSRPADPNAIEIRLNALAGRLAQLEAREAVIDQDSRSAAGQAGRAESLLIAFSARRAIDRGLGLGYLEGQLRQRFGGSQPRAVTMIIETSRNPVTVEDLRLSLDTIAPELVTGGTRGGWWPSLHREILGLITIRKDGTPSPNPADRLKRIRRMLDARQVEAALAEVARMPGAAQAGAWMAAARRFVDAHRALDLIETAAIIGPGNVDPAAVMPQRRDEKPAVTGTTIPTTATTSAP